MLGAMGTWVIVEFQEKAYMAWISACNPAGGERGLRNGGFAEGKGRDSSHNTNQFTPA